MRSVVAVAAAAFALALNAAGILDGPCSGAGEGLGKGLRAVLAGLRGSVDGIVSAGPVPCVAGPACLLVVTGDEFLGLDRGGYIAFCESTCARADLPALTGFLPASKKVGERAASAEIVIGLEIMRAFEDRPDLVKMLSEVNLGDLRNPTAILAGGTAVSLGKGDYPNKTDKLIQVLENLKRLNMSAKTIDLRFARQAVVNCIQPKHIGPKNNADPTHVESKHGTVPKQSAEPKRKAEAKNSARSKRVEPKHSAQPKRSAKKGV